MTTTPFVPSIIRKRALNYFKLIVIGSLCFLSYFFLRGKTDSSLIGFQFLIIIISAIFGYALLTREQNERRFFFVALVYLLLINCLYLLFNQIQFVFDGETYYLSTKYGLKYDGWFSAVQKLEQNGYVMEINDYGFILITLPIYKLFGQSLGFIILVLFNYIIHASTCVWLYKFCRCLFGKSSASVTTSLWCINPYIALYALSFSKESFFIFVSFGATYYTMILLKRFSIRKFLLWICFVSSTFLFKVYGPIIYILAYCLYKFFYRYMTPAKMTLFAVGCLTVALVGGAFLSRYISALGSGILEAELSYGSKGGIYQALNVINPFISPYPQFAESGDSSFVNNSTVYYSIINSGFALWGLMGFFHIISRNKHQYFPLVMMLLFNASVLIMVGFSMIARYTMTTSFIMFMFIPLGLEYYYEKKFIVPYLLFLIGITYMYNIR